MVGLSLTYNIPKFFELKLIFAEEDPNMFEGLINHSAISSAEHQNIEQPFTHLEVRNITVDIVATDLRLNQVITLFLWLSERSERNHSLHWYESPPSHYFIKRYYIDTRVQKVAILCGIVLRRY